MKCILRSFDFFLKIQQIWITQQQIFVSNKKRLIIYNYLNDVSLKNQKYYLDTYASKEPNNNLRYFPTQCQNYEDSFTINELIQIDSEECQCGKFIINSQSPFVVAYIQTISFNKQKNKKIVLYNQKEDRQRYFEETLPDQSHFSMALSPDATFLAYTFNYGRKVKVYNIKQDKLYCILHVSTSIKQILDLRLFTVQISGKPQACLSIIRKSEINKATLHIFKIQKRSPTEEMVSQYRRYFPLYENMFKDYGIAKELINPGIFIEKNVLYIYSLCGIVFEAIDFGRTGNSEKKQFEDCHNTWTLEKQEDY